MVSVLLLIKDSFIQQIKNLKTEKGQAFKWQDRNHPQSALEFQRRQNDCDRWEGAILGHMKESTAQTQKITTVAHRESVVVALAGRVWTHSRLVAVEGDAEAREH